MNIKRYQEGGQIEYLPSYNKQADVKSLTNPEWLEEENAEDAIPIVRGYQKQYSPDIEEEEEEVKIELPTTQLASQQVGQSQQPSTTSTQTTSAVSREDNKRTYHYKPEEKLKFQKDLLEAYKKELTKRGISTEFAKYLVAQDALESGWGQYYAGQWNFGNITLGSDKKHTYTLGKDHDAFGRPIVQKFRNYVSIEDYAGDKIDLLRGGSYRAFDGGVSEFYDRIGRGGYVGFNKKHTAEYIASLKATFKSIKVGQEGMKLPDNSIAYIPVYSSPINTLKKLAELIAIQQGDDIDEEENYPIKGYVPQYVIDTEEPKEGEEPVIEIVETEPEKAKTAKSSNSTQSTPAPQEQSSPTPSVPYNGPKGKITFKHPGINVGTMQPVIDKFAECGISIRITSGVRKPNEAGNKGKKSNHVWGRAIDITPGEGETWESFRRKIKESKELKDWLRQHGYGILDETIPAVMKKNNATGPHFHVGPDIGAKRDLDTIFKKMGGTIPYILLRRR